MKATELKKIVGLNLPTELPCTEDLITRLERHLADERSLQSRLAGDDPHYARNVADYKLRITLLEKFLEELRQPNFQFALEDPARCPGFSRSPEESVPPVPSITPVPQAASHSPKINFPTENPPPSESTPEPQQHPSESQVGPGGSQVIPSGFQPVSGGSEVGPNGSDPLPQPPATPGLQPDKRPRRLAQRSVSWKRKK